MKAGSYAVYPTAIGPITIVCEGEWVTGLSFGCKPPAGTAAGKSALSELCFAQLTEYLAGERKQFDVPLSMEGTAFQKRVWQALLTIPYGQTCSYAHIASQIGNPGGCRAVGMANNRNPLAILVPCHRVIGKNGGLTGYAGGLNIKKYLLELEKKHA